MAPFHIFIGVLLVGCGFALIALGIHEAKIF